MPTAYATKPKPRRASLADAGRAVDTTRLGGSATGPKLPKLAPTAVVGEPYPFPPPPQPQVPGMQPNLNVPEPAALVGMQSGQHYATLGDNPMGPETMQVTPPGGPASMAQGGYATIGPPPEPQPPYEPYPYRPGWGEDYGPGLGNVERRRPLDSTLRQVLSAETSLDKAGLPSELLSIPGLVKRPPGEKSLGGYYDQSNEMFVEPTMRQPGRPADPGVAIHESLHGFENLLTPQERARLAELIAQEPPPQGIPDRHHPGGVTAYFDYPYLGHSEEDAEGYAVQGQAKTAIPLAVQQFIRELAPEVLQRAQRLRQQGASPAGSAVGAGMAQAPVSMADGGSATIGAWNPNQGAPVYDPNQFTNLRTNLLQQQRGVLGAQGAELGANENVINAREGVIPYQRAALGAQRAVLPYSQGVLNAQQATMPARQAVIGANRNVLGARTTSLAAQRGYIGQQQGANQAELVDINAVRAARANTPDIIAVAQEAQLRNQIDRSLYNRIGVEAPMEVAVEPGQEGNLPPNMRAKLQTQADIKRMQQRDNAEMRQNQLAAARLAVDLIDTNVTEAQIAAAEAGLTLDQAQMMVDQARIEEGRAQLGARAAGFDAEEAGFAVDEAQIGAARAGLGTSRARLGESSARLDLSDFAEPSEYGYEMYTDPNTLERSWLTPADADRRGFQYSQQRGYEEYPSRYDFNEYQQQYGNEQQVARGGPLGGMGTQDLVNYWVESAMYFAPTSRADYQQQVEQSIIAAHPGDPQAAATELAAVRQTALARMETIRKAEAEADRQRRLRGASMQANIQRPPGGWSSLLPGSYFPGGGGDTDIN